MIALDLLAGLWGLFLVLIAGGKWISICNDRTLKERLGIISVIRSYCDRGDREWRTLYMFYGLVSYNEHLRRRVMFGNPKYLYHFSLWDGFEPNHNRSAAE